MKMPSTPLSLSPRLRSKLQLDVKYLRIPRIKKTEDIQNAKASNPN